MSRDNMDPVVVSEVRKAYGDIHALKGLSFSVGRGTIFGLIGPDGAGKTTLIRIIVSLLNPDKGHIMINGQNVNDNLCSVREQIGYMPQRFSLYPDLTVEQNLLFFADLFGVDRKKKRDRLAQLYAFSQLGPFRRRLSIALSGGMKQKLALSCVLMHSPDVLVLDEPTVGLDPVSRNELWRMLHQLARSGSTIVVSTSYMEEAGECDRVGLIHLGRMLAMDTPARLIAAYPYPVYHLYTHHPYETYQQLKETPFGDRISLFGKSIHLADHAGLGKSAILHALEHAGIRVDAVKDYAPSIEDIFLDHIRSRGEESQ